MGSSILDRVLVALIQYTVAWFTQRQEKADFKERVANYRQLLDELEKSEEPIEVKNEKLNRSAADVLCGCAARQPIEQPYKVYVIQYGDLASVHWSTGKRLSPACLIRCSDQKSGRVYLCETSRLGGSPTLHLHDLENR